ncbi:hypothetical protein OQA88_9548 [Cercophora sp. LCS_1]
MPTTHVEPASESHLHEIATALWKSRKVVVITGAGISTNSGIPDFRSENGLYSLIQAQFDATAEDGPASSNVDADESDLSSDFSDHRPTKRRRLSPEQTPGKAVNVEAPIEQHRVGTLGGDGGTGGPSTRDGSAHQTSLLKAPKQSSERDGEMDVIMGDADEEHAPGPPGDTLPCRLDGTPPAQPSSRRPTLTPLLSPRLSSGTADLPDTKDEFAASERQPHFVSSPPSLALDITTGSDRQLRFSVASSPLSSPPPILSDPFREYSADTSSPSPSSNSSSSLSRSESEEPSSASTPLLTSQTSFASSSSRTSLPNMKGKDLFDAQIWSCPIKTSVFYTFATTLRQKVREAEPTSSHRFVSVLRDSRKLVRCYTQNIDQLEERVGLATSLELGPGSRYRFSVRAGRTSVGVKGAVKETETPTGSQTQPGQQDDVPSESQTNVDDGRMEDDGAAAPSNVPFSAAEMSSDSTEVAAPATVSAPGPNRGVECVFLHGSLAHLRCFVCGRTSEWDEETRLADTLAGRQPTCPHCAGATAARQERGKRALGVGKLRPDIVLYGEEHPHAHLISPLVQHDLSLGPDMLLILGTSLRVHGLKVLVKEFAKAVHDRGGNVVFVNFTKPPESVWADVIDYWVQWDCDAWVSDVQKRRPALWLPPGTTLPEGDKPKASKSSRKNGNLEGAKRKSVKNSSSKRRESDEPARDVIEVSQPMDGDQPSSQEGQPGSPEQPETKQQELGGGEEERQDKAEPQKRPSRAPRPPKPREYKFNPNAKRPAAVRDDKHNGAYVIGKIMFNLGRISGRTAASSTQCSPAATTKSKPKRNRKSAPAALGPQPFVPAQQGAELEPKVEARRQDSEMPGLQPEAAPELAPAPTIPAIPELQTAPGQKEAKRLAKWRTKREKQPEEAELPDLRPNQDDSISAAVKNRKRKRTVTWKKIHGVETAVSSDGPDPASASTSSRLPGPAALLSLRHPEPPAHHFSFISHAATSSPPPHFVPHPITLPEIQKQPLEVSSPNRPQPMEVASWAPHGNPFFLNDPLSGCFGYSPPRAAPAPRPHFYQFYKQDTVDSLWGPDKQLRMEDREAAEVLAALGGKA